MNILSAIIKISGIMYITVNHEQYKIKSAKTGIGSWGNCIIQYELIRIVRSLINRTFALTHQFPGRTIL